MACDRQARRDALEAVAAGHLLDQVLLELEVEAIRRRHDGERVGVAAAVARLREAEAVEDHGHLVGTRWAPPMTFPARATRIVTGSRAGYPIPQPLTVSGDFVVGHVHVPDQNGFILAIALALMALVAITLERSRLRHAIRATAQHRSAAQLMGVRVGFVYAQVLAISGAIAAVSGVLVSSIATLTPVMGADPMLKAFIICVVAGLGNVYGADRIGNRARAGGSIGPISPGRTLILATLLLIVVIVLIWRPHGLFGRSQEERQ